MPKKNHVIKAESLKIRPLHTAEYRERVKAKFNKLKGKK